MVIIIAVIVVGVFIFFDFVIVIHMGFYLAGPLSAVLAVLNMILLSVTRLGKMSWQTCWVCRRTKRQG